MAIDIDCIAAAAAPAAAAAVVLVVSLLLGSPVFDIAPQISHSTSFPQKLSCT